MRCIFKILPIAAKTRFPFKNGGINRMLTIGLLSLTAATSLYSTETLASQLSSKADSFLSRKAGSHSKKGWTSVIVKFKGELTAIQQAQMKSLKVDIYRHLDLIHCAAVSVPTRNLQKLS